MGRYYTGDIEGKFWFGVQSSNDAIHFGGTYTYIDEEGEPLDEDCEGEAIEMHFHFGKEDTDSIREGIEQCVENLGNHLEGLDNFFAEAQSYNEEMLAKHLSVSVVTVEELLRYYARLQLGLKIENCVGENGECNFEVELQ